MSENIKQYHGKIEQEIDQEISLNVTGMQKGTRCFNIFCMVKEMRHHFRKQATYLHIKIGHNFHA